jgi:hypothetical protein
MMLDLKIAVNKLVKIVTTRLRPTHTIIPLTNATFTEELDIGFTALMTLLLLKDTYQIKLANVNVFLPLLEEKIKQLALT